VDLKQKVPCFASLFYFFSLLIFNGLNQRYKNKNAPFGALFVLSGKRDSNPRPHAPQAYALTWLRHYPNYIYELLKHLGQIIRLSLEALFGVPLQGLQSANILILQK
jgi:hypothetical protein